jgi:hypothetical protein
MVKERDGSRLLSRARSTKRVANKRDKSTVSAFLFLTWRQRHNKPPKRWRHYFHAIQTATSREQDKAWGIHNKEERQRWHRWEGWCVAIEVFDKHTALFLRHKASRIAVEGCAILLRIWTVQDSNFGSETRCSNKFSCWFSVPTSRCMGTTFT